MNITLVNNNNMKYVFYPISLNTATNYLIQQNLWCRTCGRFMQPIAQKLITKINYWKMLSLQITYFESIQIKAINTKTGFF